MLTVSSNIDAAALQPLLVDGASILFEDSQCTVEAKSGSLIGDSPYGYVDFLMPASESALAPLLLWVKSWVSFSPSQAV
jgi:hypothetical protein